MRAAVIACFGVILALGCEGERRTHGGSVCHLNSKYEQLTQSSTDTWLFLGRQTMKVLPPSSDGVMFYGDGEGRIGLRLLEPCHNAQRTAQRMIADLEEQAPTPDVKAQLKAISENWVVVSETEYRTVKVN